MMSLETPRPRVRALLRVLICLVAGITLGCEKPLQTAIAPPDIFLVSLDTVRRDAVAAYGYPGAPLTLDGFARDALVFDDVYTTTPFTLPAHMTMFTGLHHVEHGVENRKDVLSSEIKTLPENLSSQGYETVGIFTSEWLKAEFGFGRGFESYQAIPHQATYADRSIRRAFEILDNRTDDSRPIFVFLHLYDAHSDFVAQSRSNLPYYSSEQYRTDLPPISKDRFCDDQGNCATRFLLEADKEERLVSPGEIGIIHELYRRGVRELDDNLRALFDGLRQRGLYDDAAIIVTSDHGEEFREHGKFLHSQIYEESVAVPLLVKLPLQKRAGEHIRSLTALMDVYSIALEIADFAGLSELSRGPLDSGRLGVASRQSIVVQDKLWKSLWGLRTGDWLLVRDRQNGHSELYRRSDDPNEAHNIAALYTDDVRQLTNRLEDRVRLLRERGTALREADVESVLTTEEEERLRALGYLD